MHIKRMHEMIEKLTKCAEMELEKGIDKIDAEEMGEVTDMIKDLAEAEYYAKISVAMDEAEYGEDYDYRGAYDEHERRGYTGQPRSKTSGRFMRRGDGRRSYMPMMRDYDWDNMQMDRDMDREHGKMYYTEPMTMRNDNQAHSESRYDRARRGYEESKAMHKDNSPESKQMKMKSLEDYMKSLAEDVTEMVNDMSPEEKSLMKQKMQVLMQKIN
jgi:hypothetical protein